MEGLSAGFGGRLLGNVFGQVASSSQVSHSSVRQHLGGVTSSVIVRLTGDRLWNPMSQLQITTHTWALLLFSLIILPRTVISGAISESKLGRDLQKTLQFLPRGYRLISKANLQLGSRVGFTDFCPRRKAKVQKVSFHMSLQGQSLSMVQVQVKAGMSLWAEEMPNLREQETHWADDRQRRKWNLSTNIKLRLPISRAQVKADRLDCCSFKRCEFSRQEFQTQRQTTQKPSEIPGPITMARASSFYVPQEACVHSQHHQFAPRVPGISVHCHYL